MSDNDEEYSRPSEKYDFEIVRMWEARDSEAIIDYIDYNYYDGNLDCVLYSHYCNGQEFFLEMANCDELSTRALAHILLSPLAIMTSCKTEFSEPELANIYKLKDILPAYEKFYKRQDLEGQDLNLAGKGFSAFIHALEDQINDDDLLKRILKIIAKQCRNELPSKMVKFTPERICPLMVADDGLMETFYSVTCSSRTKELAYRQFDKVFLGRQTISRNMLNFFYPFLVVRGHRTDYTPRLCLCGAPTNEDNFFQMMRNNSRHLHFCFQLCWRLVNLTEIQLIVLLEICSKDIKNLKDYRLEYLVHHAANKRTEISSFVDQPLCYSEQEELSSNSELYLIPC